jgi:hypothetical protein
MRVSSQEYDFRKDDKAKLTSWLILQAIPNPSFFDDSDGRDSRLQFGLKWNVTLLNISLDPNKYVSPFQFFMIDPVRRFTGSVEFFIQPEITTASFKFADRSFFGLTGGSRFLLPITDRGEAMSLSVGGKYTYRKSYSELKDHYFGLETGVYFLAGLIGLQITKNFDEQNRYNINFYFKYY